MENVKKNDDERRNESVQTSWGEFERKIPFEFTNDARNEIVNDAVHEALKVVNKMALDGVLSMEHITEDTLREEAKKQVVEALCNGRYTNEMFKAFKPSNYMVSEQTAKWIKRYNDLEFYMGGLSRLTDEIENDDFAPNIEKLNNEFIQFWKNFDRIIISGLTMSINDIRGFVDCPKWLI